ncbi:MAG: leucine-rich repeat domain-containing protein, partial [Bacteroidota bacterium]
KEKLKQQALDLSIPTPGYFRLTPYEAKDASQYTRIDGTHERVLGWLQEEKHPILYLSGESGTGKSSLLNGYVIPNLPDYKVIPIRGYTNPVKALTQALREESAKKGSSRKMLEEVVAKHKGKCLLVFDQFEEFLILREEEEQDELEALFQSLSADPIPNLTVLLVFRSDYLAELLKLNIPELEPNHNWEIVGAFGTRESRKFLEDSGMQLGEGIIKDILGEAESLEGKPGLIRPIILNMYGMILSKYAGELPKGVSSDSLLKNYLEECIDISNFRENARDIIKELISKKGTKQPRSVEELHQLTNINEGVLKGFLLELAPKGIVRRVDVGKQVWEISHDFLALLLHRSMFTWKLPLYSRVAKWATPVLILAWIGIMFYVWPTWRNGQTINQLREMGFRVSEIEERKYSVRSLVPVNDSIFRKVLPVLGKLSVSELDFMGSQIDSLPDLTTLPYLDSLNLGRNRIQDISAISQLPQLHKLVLSENRIEDISPLKELKNLSDLYLFKNSIQDISALKELKNLSSLYLFNNSIQDISPLSAIKLLRSLGIDEIYLQDSAFISSLIRRGIKINR